MCAVWDSGLHGKGQRVKAPSECSKWVVNSVSLSRDLPVFPGFFEIIRVFNSKNTESFGRRYQILKKAIKSDQFQNAIRLIDFHFETRRTRRIIKEILNFTMKTRLYLFTYMMIKLYVGKI